MPQFDSHLACFDCRVKCKGQDPCPQGADLNQCALCSMLSDEKWTHLRESFAKSSSYCNRTGSQYENFTGKNVEPETELSQVDDTLNRYQHESSWPAIFNFSPGDEFPSLLHLLQPFSRRQIRYYTPRILSQLDKHPTDNIWQIIWQLCHCLNLKRLHPHMRFPKLPGYSLSKVTLNSTISCS